MNHSVTLIPTLTIHVVTNTITYLRELSNKVSPEYLLIGKKIFMFFYVFVHNERIKKRIFADVYIVFDVYIYISCIYLGCVLFFFNPPTARILVVFGLLRERVTQRSMGRKAPRYPPHSVQVKFFIMR